MTVGAGLACHSDQRDVDSDGPARPLGRFRCRSPELPPNGVIEALNFKTRDTSTKRRGPSHRPCRLIPTARRPISAWATVFSSRKNIEGGQEVLRTGAARYFSNAASLEQPWLDQHGPGAMGRGSRLLQERPLAIDPAYANAHYNLGNIYKVSRSAVGCVRLLSPGHVYRTGAGRGPHYDLGVVLAEQHRVPEAVASYPRGPFQLACRRCRGAPSAGLHGWLLSGDYEQGWDEYEWRFRWDVQARDFPLPRLERTRAWREKRFSSFRSRGSATR